MSVHYVVIGGGIVGLSVAMHLLQETPDIQLTVLEKENRIASHQSGRNSGVIHSGIYYQPGTLKARYARDGNRSMIQFCRANGIPHHVSGKVIVATHAEEFGRLEELHRRAISNGLDVRSITKEEVRELEPHVRCCKALYVSSTGVVDFGNVCAKYAELIAAAGGTIRTGVEVTALTGQRVVETNVGDIRSDLTINCAGLQSDRLARQSGINPGIQIVPFRGEYYELMPDRRHLVNSLIYPVPDPSFPFLGIHLTRGIGGSVHAGPNAVLALCREGYGRRDLSLRDLGELLSYGGFWRFATRHWLSGITELRRSLSKKAFLREVQRLVPKIRAEDLIPSPPGVRAQALAPDGRLVDDFLIIRGERSIHVCNVPSPAATASLEIGRNIAARVREMAT